MVAPSVAPARSARLTPEARRGALEISTVEGMFATAHAALSGNGVGGNVFSSGYALLLGATNFQLGVLAALPQLATTAQTLAAYATQVVRSRRGLVVAACAVARSLFFAAPFLPFLLGRGDALFAFIALFGAAAFTYEFAGNAWRSWMADLVPSAIRGRYLSRRSNLCNVVGLAAGVAGALALDAYAGGLMGSSPEADARRLGGFVVVFVAAAAFGGVSTLLLRHQPEPERPPVAAAPPPLRDFVAVPFRDPEFRRALAFFALFSFAHGLGNPYWIPFVLEDLHQSYTFHTVLTCVGGVAGLLTLPLWGRALDRFGAKPCLGIAAVASAIHPLCYVVATPDFLLPIYWDYISAGIVWGGWNVAIFDLLLTLAPAARAGRDMYIAAQAAAVGLALAAGSLVSGALVDRMPGGRETIFASVTAIRLLALPLLARLREPGARPVGELLVLARRTLFGV